MKQDTAQDKAIWWGETAIQSGKRLQLRCGDLQLDILPKDNEWLVQYQLSKDLVVFKAELSYNDETDDAIEFENKQRFVSNALPDHVILQPALADRSITCKPKVTVSLFPKQQISLFVGLPLWLQLHMDGIETALLDIPTVRISDSWFGPDSRKGVICYASTNNEQLDLKPTVNHGTRVTLEVRVKNNSDAILSLDKLSIPVPHLALYVDKENEFYTRRMTLTREQDENASLTIDDVMSCGLTDSDVTLVTKAREDIGRSKITKALSALFG